VILYSLLLPADSYTQVAVGLTSAVFVFVAVPGETASPTAVKLSDLQSMLGSTPDGKIKRLLIVNAYNSTLQKAVAFNSSDKAYSDYAVSDVLKATMAAPLFFPLYKFKSGNKGADEWYIDGGVFANDPEVMVSDSTHVTAILTTD
jgi:predicted acylesterase/phospholipase RssA